MSYCDHYNIKSLKVINYYSNNYKLDTITNYNSHNLYSNYIKHQNNINNIEEIINNYFYLINNNINETLYIQFRSSYFLCKKYSINTQEYKVYFLKCKLCNENSIMYFLLKCNQINIIHLNYESFLFESNKDINNIAKSAFNKIAYSEINVFNLMHKINEESKINSMIKNNIIKKPLIEYYINNTRDILISQLEELIKEYDYSDKVFYHALYSLDYVFSFGTLCIYEECLANENHYYILLGCFCLASKFNI